MPYCADARLFLHITRQWLGWQPCGIDFAGHPCCLDLTPRPGFLLDNLQARLIRFGSYFPLQMFQLSANPNYNGLCHAE
jgi:hypothetical protein